MPKLIHYLCWFSSGAISKEGFVPGDGGCEFEADQVAWEMSEVLRDDFGIHLEAFVPVMPDLKSVALDRLPTPGRCLEVFSENLLETMRQTPKFDIKDIFKEPKEIAGMAIADWLQGYRKRWQQGFFIVRLPDTGA